MAFITSHYACNNPAVQQTNQKQVWSHTKLASNIFDWVIPRSNQVTSVPKRDNRCLIVQMEWSNFHKSVELLNRPLCTSAVYIVACNEHIFQAIRMSTKAFSLFSS